MSPALVLGAGASWAAYQVGALRHAVGERGMAFDLLAGTGIGAMNAAFVACGELAALEALWRRIGPLRLVRPSLRRPWLGPLDGAPQRRAIAAHVSEEKLAARGATLLVSTLDLRSGRLHVLEYPGAEPPLLDGLMAAVATPGMVAPLASGGRLLAEGTLVDSTPLAAVLARGPGEVLLVAPATPRDAPPKRMRTWRDVSRRALALNLDRDVWAGLEEARLQGACADAHRSARAALLALVDERAGNSAVAAPLRAAVEAAHPAAWAPVVRAVTPSRELPYPLWRFRRAELAAAEALGHADARAALAGAAA